MRSLDREIRLLDLLPGGRNDAIRCTTRVVSLDQHPDFETVSYVWGDRKGEENINVSDNCIPVTKNLHAGLLRLRHPTIKRTLWIDQICINQWDLEEKAAQVALMRDIYRLCTRCVTWMGELARDGIETPIKDAEAVFDFLRQASAAMIVPLDGLPVLFQDTTEGSAARGAFERFSMYGNPWWSRIWTVQEAIIPPSGVFVWGPLSISRETVLSAARNLRDLNSWPSLPEGFASCRYTYTELLRRLLYPVHGFNHSKVDSPLNLLMRWRHREFTDPRDKVYALLGMIASEAIPSARSCDYTIDVPRLFAHVTQDLIMYENSLRPLLGACEMLPLTVGSPSWAIDFARCNRIGKRQLKWWGHSHRYNAFSACGNNVLEVGTPLGCTTLGLRGVFVDELLGTVELLRVDAQDPITFDEIRDPLAACLRLLQQYRNSAQILGVYKDGFTWDSAFCRTMVGDLIMDEIPVGRIASYGRSRLQANFEELFDKLHIPWEEKVDLDFIALREQEPESPLSLTQSGPDVPSSPTYSPESAVIADEVSIEREDSSRQIAGATANGSGARRNLPVTLQRSDSNASLESSADSDSQWSYTSEMPIKNWKPAKQSRNLDVSDVSRQTISSDNSTRSPSRYNLGHTKEATDDQDQKNNRERGSTKTPRPTEEDSNSETNLSRGVRDRHPPWLNQTFTELYESLTGMMENQTFFVTKSGYIGIGPPQLSTGDQVWIFNGGNVPFIMREIDEEKNGCPQLALIGDAYVHGVMDGEAMENRPHLQTVHIH